LAALAVEPPASWMGEAGGSVDANDRRVDGIIDNTRRKHAKRRR
jgi:hypothetical protein